MKALVPRALTIAGSDSGGGAGIQADLKAFAATGCHGMTAIVALTAQDTMGVNGMHEMPAPVHRAPAQDCVSRDPGVDAAKTGMLFSRQIIETVAEFLRGARVPLVVDPVMVASSGARLLQEDAVDVLVERLFPLATVVTPNCMEAQVLAGGEGSRRELAEAIARSAAPPAVIVTGGHGDEPVDHLFDGADHVEIPVPRHEVAATHGAGCTHSAALDGAAGPRPGRSPPLLARPRRSPRAQSSTGTRSSAAATARSTSWRWARRDRRRTSTGCASASRSSTRSPTTWS